MTRAPAPAGPDLDAITVVIPARDEEATLPGCLRALRAAADHLERRAPGIRLRTLVVLDSCTDASAEVVRGLGVDHVEVAARSVGAARARGAEIALGSWSGPEATHWIACTDADTRVPAHWLLAQAEAAADGVDVLVGTVEPDAELPDTIRRAWAERHDLTEGHAHVHGANLGVRGSAYRAAGGFAPLRVHEDVDLVQRLRALPGVRVQATDEHRVVTSGRRSGRTPGGFAGYLRDLPEGVG